MIQIASILHLKELAFQENGDFVHFDNLLAGGLARSSKRISYRPTEEKQWLFINEIDESFQELLERNLSKRTSIVEAINKKALYLPEMS